MITGSLLLFIIASSSKPLNRTHTHKKKKKKKGNTKPRSKRKGQSSRGAHQFTKRQMSPGHLRRKIVFQVIRRIIRLLERLDELPESVVEFLLGGTLQGRNNFGMFI